jgi:dienelactone hydrolase
MHSPIAQAATRSVRGVLACLLLTLHAVLQAQPGAVTPVTDFAGTPGNGWYGFASSTPRSLAEVVDRSRPRAAASAAGQLWLPPGAKAGTQVPAVVLVHGSGGVYPELAEFWAARLNAQGIAAFIVDIFGPRGVQSTAEDQSLVPFSADLADSFAALGLLASHPSIDRQRIAIMGFSRGGTAAWRTAVRRIGAGLGSEGLRFAAHIPVYSGGCTGITSMSVRPGVFGPAPMLWLHGDEDDYTDAGDCKAYAQSIQTAGTPAEFVLLPGARHKFDMNSPRRIHLPRAIKSRRGCPLEFDIDALTYRDRRDGSAIAASDVGTFAKTHCTATGATIEGDRTAREAAAQAVDAFLKRIFKL